MEPGAWSQGRDLLVGLPRRSAADPAWPKSQTSTCGGPFVRLKPEPRVISRATRCPLSLARASPVAQLDIPWYEPEGESACPGVHTTVLESVAYAPSPRADSKGEWSPCAKMSFQSLQLSPWRAAPTDSGIRSRSNASGGRGLGRIGRRIR